MPGSRGQHRVPGTFVLPAVPRRQRQPVPGRSRRHERVVHRAPAMPSPASLPGSWSAARRGRVELQRARRPDGRAGSGEEHQADVPDPAADLAPARRVQGNAVDRVLRQAADGQRRAPVTGVTAAAVELLHPARRVEPQFGEGRSRIDTADHVHLSATVQGSPAIEYPSGTARSRRPRPCSPAGGAGQVARRPPVRRRPPCSQISGGRRTGHGPGLGHGLERELRLRPGALHIDRDDLAGPQLAEQDPLRQIVLDLPLDRAAQRPRAEHRIIAPLGQQRPGRGQQLQAHVPVLEPLIHLGDHQVHDGENLLLAEPAEHDGVIDPVQELRPEVLLQLLLHRGPHPVIRAL